MKYEVVVGTLWVNGTKHRRGDVIELSDATEYGVRVQPHHEAPKPAPAKRKRRTKAEMEAAKLEGKA